jgi:hypothetical protein
MNKQICKYSIIRFQPYAETEEFANIGVVLYASAAKRIEFRLLDGKQHTRITHFFDPECKEVFIQATKIIRDEIERIQKILEFEARFEVDFYEDLIRSREDIIRFSDSRVLFSIDPVATVDKLFNHYIHRSFIHEPSFEDLMKSQVRDLLVSRQLYGKFKDGSIGAADKYEVKFPFVRNIGELKVIKPIHFRHDKPTPLIEHGIKWISKVQQLQKYHFIQPEQILFAYQAPDKNQVTLFNAFNEVKQQAVQLGVVMADIKATDDIADFARC